MTAPDEERAGTYWLAYYSDWSGFVVFADEVQALRHAVMNHMDGVIEVPFGADPKAGWRRD